MASLKTEYSIKKFAPFVVMAYSKTSNVSPEFLKCFGEFMSDETFQAIFDCINLLLKYYKYITNKISMKEFEDKLYLTSKRKYMEQLVTRCLMLSEGEPTFFEFLLVCVYICQFSRCIYAEYRCFKILKVTADCLEAVHCNKYWHFFEEHMGFLGFAYFCRDLNNCMPFIRYANGEFLTLFEGAIDLERYAKVKNLGGLNVVDNIIPIFEIEEKLCENKPYFNPSRRNESSDFLIECKVVSATVKHLKMKLWKGGTEKLHKADISCKHCRSNCSDYPRDLVKEINICKMLQMEY